MENEVNLPFNVGQEAEGRSFENGFRGAWFRCKIVIINKKEGLLDFYDFPDDKPEWTKLYQVPPNEKHKVLVLRPCYPPIYRAKQMPHASVISQVSVIVDGSWKVGDMVDGWSAECFWCGRISQLLGDGKAKIQLEEEPHGEGSDFDVELKDVRPSLDWSLEYGWTMPTQKADSGHPSAWLLKPINQDAGKLQITDTNNPGQGTEAGRGRSGSNSAVSDKVKSTGSTAINKRSLRSRVPRKLKNIQKKNTSHGFREIKTDSGQTPAEPKADVTDEDHLRKLKNIQKKSTSHGFREIKTDSGQIPAEPKAKTDSGPTPAEPKAKTDSGQTPAEPKADDTDGDHLNSTCSMKKYTAGGGLILNSMRYDTLEAAVMDLEEYVNKVKWLKTILGFGISSSDSTKSQWEFVEPPAASDNTPK